VKSGAVVLVEESLISSEVGHCIVIQVLGVRARVKTGPVGLG
jgi:hypothetical protein